MRKQTASCSSLISPLNELYPGRPMQINYNPLRTNIPAECGLSVIQPNVYNVNYTGESHLPPYRHLWDIPAKVTLTEPEAPYEYRYDQDFVPMFSNPRENYEPVNLETIFSKEGEPSKYLYWFILFFLILAIGFGCTPSEEKN